MKLPHYDVTITLSDPEHPDAKRTFVLARQEREKLLNVDLLAPLVEDFESNGAEENGELK